ncbi:MAG: aldo/keto reductase [Clostridiales bacterium]|nr:aldo/keto reductase [Clostridiales bacterium]
MSDTKYPMLGFGLMRLPENDGVIDLDQVCKMVDRYLESGNTYFDTAYIYHGGNSEKVVKDAIVSRYPRDSFTLATKLPAWCIKTAEDRDRIFEEQLERMGTDYVDYYLLHSIEDGNNYDTYEKFDCFNWAMEKKAQGKIKHFGFSFHGTPELLEKVLDKHPEVEFVQIQLNYADWDSELICSGKLYRILHSRNIPITVMEPVKGGTLANMIPAVEELYKNARPDMSVASWALRFVGSLPGVRFILSGMSKTEQMEDNLKTFTNFEPLSVEEKEIVQKARRLMFELELVPCTACRYCVDGCPSNISIPDIFKALNDKRKFPNDIRPNFYYNGLTAKYGKAEDCLACGQCEGVCPQHLNIIELLKEASEKFDNFKM